MNVGRIGFAYNPTIEQAVELSERAAGWCRMRGVDQWAVAGGRDRGAVRAPRRDRRAGRARRRRHVPAGGPGRDRRRRADPGHQPRARSGFLSKAETDELEAVLEKLQRRRLRRPPADGPRRVDPAGRPARAADVHRPQRHRHRPRLAGARGPDVDVSIDESHLATFIADGLVVSSPTGSTGYSFSAGGPILDPQQPQPRRHADRRLPVGDPVGRRVAAPGRALPGRSTPHEALVSIDGREDHRIEVGDVVEVRALERPIRFVEPAGTHAVLGPAADEGPAAAVVTGGGGR